MKPKRRERRLSVVIDEAPIFVRARARKGDPFYDLPMDPVVNMAKRGSAPDLAPVISPLALRFSQSPTEKESKVTIGLEAPKLTPAPEISTPLQIASEARGMNPADSYGGLDGRMSVTATVFLYLRERQPGFEFTAPELVALVAEAEGAVSAALSSLTQEGFLSRDHSGRGTKGQPIFKYKVLAKIMEERPINRRPKEHTADRKPGAKRRAPTPPAVAAATPQQLVSEITDRLALLESWANQGLKFYTNKQLIDELHRRSSEVVP